MSSLLTIAIPTYNRGPMLEAIVDEFLPTAEELQVTVVISDNASRDDTAARVERLTKRSPLVSCVRQAQEVPIHENVMAALQMSRGTYTWWTGDDDFIHAGGLRRAHRWLERNEPSAVLFPTLEVDEGFAVDAARPLREQVVALSPDDGFDREPDAAAFFAKNLYRPQLGSFIVRTADALATDYHRYYPTYHPHLGALYDALDAEQDRTGQVSILNARAPVGISLTRVGDRAKTWGHLREELAKTAMPLWIDLLPERYAAHRERAREEHRHIFRDILDPG